MTTCSSKSMEIIEIKPGLRFTLGVLAGLLPDVETTLFFGKVYALNHGQLSQLLLALHHTSVADALFNGQGHSENLQSYVLEMAEYIPAVNKGELKVNNHVVPKGEILPDVWASLEVEVATSIQAVADKLKGVVDKMPGKQGEMFFKTLAVMNKKRPTLGDYRAQIVHKRAPKNLIVLDVSGSMSASTVHAIIDDVVAMAYMANAALAIVSNTTTFWEPGTYDSDTVVARAEFGGTRYETLAPVFNQDWGVVVTIADYDSSYAAMPAIAAATGHVDEVLDISLVNRPTFLAEVIGQKADKVRPLLIGNSTRVMRG